MIGSFIKLPWNDHFIDGIGKGVQARNGPEHLVFVKESIKIDISRSLFSFPLVTWVFLEIQVTPGSSVGKTCGEFCVSMASFLSVDLHWTLDTAHHSTCSPPVKSLVLYGPPPQLSRSPLEGGLQPEFCESEIHLQMVRVLSTYHGISNSGLP